MEKYDNANGVSKLFTVYEGLINAKSLEDVIKVVNDSGSTTTYLRSHVHDYLIKYRRDDYDEYMALIKSKIKMYSENKKMQRKESDKLQKEETHKKYVDSMLPNANKLIKMFINSSCFTVSEFVNNSSINVNTKLSFNDIFNKCLELVKEYNKELYNEYLDKLEKEKINFYNLHIDNIYTILSLLKNGIDENGMKRSFDLIDYFGVTSLSLNDTLKFARELYEKKNITSKDYSLFSRFTAQNKNGDYESRRDISTIYAETIKVNVIRKNENGVSNTLETITNETKEKLIEYLRNANIPVNYLTYTALLNKYKMGYLLLEDYKAY